MVLAKTYVGRERTNENTNGLLREYFAKGKPIDEISCKQVQQIYDGTVKNLAHFSKVSVATIGMITHQAVIRLNSVSIPTHCQLRI